MWAIYYYVDHCGYCEHSLPEIVEFFTERCIPLVIRKPTIEERPAIKGFPALLIPRGKEAPYLLLGTDIGKYLREKPELLDGFANDRIAKPPASNGDAGI